jgi:hypothetical protein
MDARRAGADANPRFRGPSVRLGVGYNTLSFRSGAIAEGVGGRVQTVTMQLSPRLSTHVEFSTTPRAFLPAPGSVSQEVLDNLVPTTARVASPSAGLASRHVTYSLSQLAGVQVGVWDRVRLEALAGLGVQGYTKRDYYPAYTQFTAIPGKFYVLDFETPESGFVAGVDAELTIAGGLAVVPSFRYYPFGDPGHTYSLGAGVHWRLGR